VFWTPKNRLRQAPAKVDILPLPALKGFLDDQPSILDGLRAVTASAPYRQLARQFEHWPPNSVVSSHERTVLHWLISETQARNVLEIGTAFAGTTLALSASMLQAGAGLGRVYTIDPYGEARVPQILAGWPELLRELTTFWPKFSSDLFIPSLDVPPFDVILVDGNHSYPNVMHDLFASYEGLKYGGFMVADNAEQQDVLDAVRDFCMLTPDADKARLSVGARTEEGDYECALDDALEPNDSPSAFVVIRKPKVMRIGRRALAFHLNRFRGLSVSSVEISLANPTDRPVRLAGRINLRSLPSGLMDTSTAHDLGETFAADVAPGRHELDVSIKALALPAEAQRNRNFVELNLSVARDQDALTLEGVKINGFPVNPGRNFMPTNR
jgi:predicted O-methyltransferase YrrM